MGKKITGMGCLVLFGIPFALAGIAITCVSIGGLIKWRAAAAWEAVPAVIVEANLASRRSDDSTVYEIQAEYRYEYEGTTYTGTKVRLFDVSNSFRSMHTPLLERLEALKESGTPTVCYVSPEAPEEAVLYRDIDWLSAFYMPAGALLFGGVGFGIILYALYARRAAQYAEAAQARQPDAPWTWNQAWQSGTIRSHSIGYFVRTFAPALGVNLLSAPLAVLIPREASTGQHLLWLFLIFPIIGAVLAYFAVRDLLRYLRYGRSTLLLDTMPGVIGGTLRGTVRTKARVRPDRPFTTALKCVNRYTTRSGGKTTTNENTVWEDERTLDPGVVRDEIVRTVIPVHFEIPYDARPSCDEGSDKIYWRLSVRGEVAGPDYAAEFEIPVFRTAESATAPAPIAAGSDTQVPGIADDALASQRIQVVPLMDHGIRFISQPGRGAKPFGFLMMFMSVICIMVPVPIFLFAKQVPVLVLVISLPAGLLFGCLMFYEALRTFFEERVTDIQYGTLALQTGLVYKKRVVLQEDEIQGIGPKSTASANNVPYYSLVASTTAGKEHALARYFDRKDLPEELGRRMMQVLKMEGV